MVGIVRYHFPDPYTLEELRLKYTNTDTKGRIQLLNDLLHGDDSWMIPYEIALLAVEDPNLEVRQWLARHGKYLDYSERRLVDNVWVCECPERNLEERLKNDPHPFVRACLRENTNVFCRVGLGIDEEFRESSHLERLALMRNAELRWGTSLLEKIFDHEEKELGINEEERQELILAFLTNKTTLGVLQEKAGLSGDSTSRYDEFGRNDADSTLTTLWELAAKWPKNEPPFTVPEMVFRCVPVSDKTKMNVYRGCNERLLRKAITESCTKHDVETLKLGFRDKDEYCALGARQKAYDFGLDQLVEAAREEGESNTIKRRAERIKNWWYKERDGLMILMIFIGGILLIATEKGNRISGRLLDVLPTSLQTIVSWLFVIFVALSGLLIVGGLFQHFSWFYHLFMLSLVGWFQFIAEQQTTAGILAIVYLGSVVLPRWWETLSDQLADKIIKKIDLVKKEKSISGQLKL